jgi:hypothetical protein
MWEMVFRYENPTSSNVVDLVIGMWEMVFQVHRTYLVAHICQSSNGCLIGDICLRAKTGLHALGRSLQHLAKEVQRAFAMFEAPQVDVKLFHYKVL